MRDNVHKLDDRNRPGEGKFRSWEILTRMVTGPAIVYRFISTYEYSRFSSCPPNNTGCIFFFFSIPIIDRDTHRGICGTTKKRLFSLIVSTIFASTSPVWLTRGKAENTAQVRRAESTIYSPYLLYFNKSSYSQSLSYPFIEEILHRYTSQGILCP